MAFEAYVKITGEKQGGFKGESTRKGREDWMPILRFEWAVMSPKDVSTGRSAGRRKHEPFTFWKELGASSPQIFQALCTNEGVKEMKVEFMKTNRQGHEEVYMTLDFKDAQISGVKYSTGGTELGGEASARGSKSAHDLHEQESVSLTYSEVTITNNLASTSATDSWDQVV